MRAARRAAAARAACAAVVTTLCGCGAAGDPADAAPGERIAARLDAIAGGEPAPNDTAVVGFFAASTGSLCSGSLVAPNVVLTARHCVSPTLDEVGGGVACDQTRSGELASPLSFLVTTAPEITAGSIGEYFAAEVVGLPVEDDLLCGHDLSILILKDNVSPETAVPFVPRVDEPLEAGETYTALGYGATGNGGAGAGVRRRRDGLVVDCVGAECPASIIAPTEWRGDEGVCSGDSGGPAVDAQGRVVGVASRGAAGCKSPVYGHVQAWGDWLKNTVAYASGLGTYPLPAWAEGATVDPQHSMPVGDPCQADADCFSGACVDDGTSSYCTRACNDMASCPLDYVCSAEEPRVCVVDRPPAPEPPAGDPLPRDDGGCSIGGSPGMGGGSGGGLGALAGALAGLGALVHRKRLAPRDGAGDGGAGGGGDTGGDEDAEGRRSWLGVVALAALGAVAIVLLTRQGPEPGAGVPVPTAVSSAQGSAEPRQDEPPRCTPVHAEPFVVGEPPKARAAETDAAAGDDEEEELSPFAVEIGRGTTYEGGFAIGALRDAEGGSVAWVATLGLDGRGGKLVRLARSRGDMEAPVVAGAGGSIFAAMHEPNAGGRAIRIARVRGEEVAWGPELAEGRDESLAVDLAVSGSHAVLVWDDVSKDDKRSRVMLASFDPESMRSLSAARPVSPPKVDAESPRLSVRAGGFWLAYVARATAAAPPKKREKKAEGESDTESAGETIDASWVEIVPLDEAALPAGAPRAVTPKDGHVLGFDLETGEGGAAIVAFRDDDTPSGSSGGKLASTVVRPSGIEEPATLAEEGLGAGIPEVLPGWLAMADVSGATRLAAMTQQGKLEGELRAEPSLRGAEPLAGSGKTILVAKPAGRAMKLSVVRCARTAP